LFSVRHSFDRTATWDFRKARSEIGLHPAERGAAIQHAGRNLDAAEIAQKETKVAKTGLRLRGPLSLSRTTLHPGCGFTPGSFFSASSGSCALAKKVPEPQLTPPDFELESGFLRLAL
jgi:hypothetical protein